MICELITLLRANQIAGITSDFKRDTIKKVIGHQVDLNSFYCVIDVDRIVYKSPYCNHFNPFIDC